MSPLAIGAIVYVVMLALCVAAIVIGQIPGRRRAAWRIRVLDGVCPHGFRPPLGDHSKNWRCSECPNRTNLR